MSPITKIIKRQGQTVEFDQNKITSAIKKAYEATGGQNAKIPQQISNQVCAVLEVFFKDDDKFPNVEQIQDLIEKILMEGGHVKTAKAFILYRENRKNIRSEHQNLLNGRTTKLNISSNALRVIAGRYLQRNDKGEVCETPEEMFDRVALALAKAESQFGAGEKQIENWREKFRDVLNNFEFTPAGRTLTNAGGKTRLVANCIVLHFEDSMDGIFQTLKDAALLQQAGSGLGFPWHLLRPAGTRAKLTQGVASGPVSFLHAFNKAFGVIKQQNRHGANMGVMRVDHPDILEFIESKWEEGELENFNISVALTDEFMKQVESKSKEPWMCEWRGEKMKPRRIFRNNRGAFVKAEDETITAEELMDKIIESAWRNGEPGVLFPDAANKANPVPKLGRLEATNPCGEQWLHDGDVCNLGSLNLAKFVKNGEIDLERLKHVTQVGVRMLDNVIDLSEYPSEKVNRTSKNNRRVGLGVMGFADMLYQMRIPYNSEKGREIAEIVQKTITDEAHAYSEKLAEEKGLFPNWKLSIYAEDGKNRKMRNAALTTVAPTGSISMAYECSSGIEPVFALAYYKEVMGGQQLTYLNPYLKEELKKLDLYNDEILNKIQKTGSVQDIMEIPEETRKVFVTAMDISADDHIKMQASFQKHVDNSISKTINFPNSATREDVKKGYVLAWEMGLKGVTVYRDGSRQEQVLNLQKVDKDEKKKEEKAETKENFVEVSLPPIKEEREHQSFNKKDIIKSKKCPECGSTIQVGEGCLLCNSCGFTVCTL
ncbi:MAG: adenosylcobalamin-dependent ribonucleoside-diphosphate reductase [Candidatus Gracilibacteria bacterium]|jgi:ribonucleoside-diphosphate reductase alpha chain|nr:adenosylcobalamin-dependent ribonucleoside-diphosphate reductase [Candidatus Gracilibacteria bacterium]